MSARRTRSEAVASVRWPDEGIAWRTHALGEPVGSTVVAVNAAMLSRIAQHLKAREWAKATGRGQRTPSSLRLEKWAERWSRNQPLEAGEFAGSPPSEE